MSNSSPACFGAHIPDRSKSSDLRSARLRALSVLALAASLGSAVLADSRGSASVARDRVAGGEHWRIETTKGPLHVWKPAGYDDRRAGIVVYVHGYYVDGDGAWEQHALARQFQASGRNALFVVPPAPSSSDEPVRSPNLRDLLRDTVARQGLRLPHGPLVVIGHSAAHRTIVPWLANPRIAQAIFLDAVYGDETVAALREWVKHRRGRLILAAADTAPDTEKLVRALPETVRRREIPERDVWSAAERHARVVYLLSQYPHLELVSSGKAIAPLLGLTSLLPVRAPR